MTLHSTSNLIASTREAETPNPYLGINYYEDMEPVIKHKRIKWPNENMGNPGSTHPKEKKQQTQEKETLLRWKT